MNRQVTRLCANCGTEWSLQAVDQAQDDISSADDFCPICHFPASADAADIPLALDTIRDLEARLRALISEARSNGLDDDSIAGTLREELEFVAEMAHSGHRFSVQIIDLGPQDIELTQRPLRDRREILQTRSVGQ